MRLYNTPTYIISMNTCEKIFWQRSLKSLKIFEKHFENISNISFRDLEKGVYGHIKFSPRQHLGCMCPLFYTDGLPSQTWICTYCHGEESSPKDE